MLSSEEVGELLQPFCPSLSTSQTEEVMKYLNLLLRWNKTINLTSITTPEEIVQRHFGESFFLSRAVELQGLLLDIGSGAGFPGLALKILCRDLPVTLLEPVAKKRAFLKEVGRECGFSGVEVLPDRIETFAAGPRLKAYDAVTARAVGHLESLIPHAAKCVKLRGSIALWLGEDQVKEAHDSESSLRWLEPVAIPLSNRRVILVGQKA